MDAGDFEDFKVKFECFEEEDGSDVDEVASFETVLDPLDNF